MRYTCFCDSFCCSSSSSFHRLIARLFVLVGFSFFFCKTSVPVVVVVDITQDRRGDRTVHTVSFFLPKNVLSPILQYFSGMKDNSVCVASLMRELLENVCKERYNVLFLLFLDICESHLVFMRSKGEEDSLQGYYETTTRMATFCFPSFLGEQLVFETNKRQRR